MKRDGRPEIGQFTTTEGELWTGRHRVIHIEVNGVEVYRTESDRDAALFKAELLARS